MTMLNGFLFLMLLFVGVAVALILIELRNAEERADRELSCLEAADRPMGQPIMVGHHQYRTSSFPKLKVDFQSANEAHFRRLTSFITISSTPEQMTASASPIQVSYDFSSAAISTKKEQATVCPLSDTLRSDCCA